MKQNKKSNHSGAWQSAHKGFSSLFDNLFDLMAESTYE
jgi:hypothetical protein